jgi:uncharacterized protein (DUF488 family)
MSSVVRTVGHGALEPGAFGALVRDAGVDVVVDVRRYPGSRRHPHFGSEAMAGWLPADFGVLYRWCPALGGRRRPAEGSPNVGLRNEQFRAYADHMATDEFRTAVDGLVASTKRTCVMCAEAVPWRCHRNVLADDLTRRRIEVLHILGPRSIQRHVLNSHARIEGDRVVYPGPDHHDGQGSLL